MSISILLLHLLGVSRFVETLLSVIETCRQQYRDVYPFINEAIQAKPT